MTDAEFEDLIAFLLASEAAGTPSAVSPESLAQSPAFLAHFHSYWYSLSNLGHLTSRSGLGVRLIPTDDQIRALREMAGITQGPANAFLVQALYSSGDPSFVRPYDGNENDFANFRWDQSKMDRTVTPQAMGYAMIKEVIWAKSFATDVEGPSPLNHFRALTLSTEAAAQARFAAKHLISGDGLLVHGWKDDQINGLIHPTPGPDGNAVGPVRAERLRHRQIRLVCGPSFS